MWISRCWIKLKSIYQVTSYRRLVIALALSLLLHLLLIGKFSFNLSGLNEHQDSINVRLMLPKVLPNSAQSTPVVKHAAKHAKHSMAAEPKESNSIESVVQDNPQPALPTELPPVNTVTSIESSEVAKPDVESQVEALDLTVKSEPYQYVESEFNVYVDKESVSNRAIVGDAKVVYQRLPNSEQYQIKSLIQARGLVSIFMPDLLQMSDGYLNEVGLQPMHYIYQFGNDKDKTYSADFNWESKKLILKSEKGIEKLDLQTGTQDLLSFMYQFMFVPPMQNMQLSITNGRKLGLYDYTFEGEEVISTKMGNLKAFHLLRSAESSEKRTELWLALDYQHVPVKIRETNKEGKVYELLVTSLKTSLPVTSQE